MSSESQPTTGPTIAICPRCRTQLRLLAQPDETKPIKCFQCQTIFYFEVIDTAPVDETPSVNGNRPLPPQPAAPAFHLPPLPGSRAADGPPALKPITLTFGAPAVLPAMTSAVPPEVAAAVEEQPATSQPSTIMLSSPPPPRAPRMVRATTATDSAAPAMPNEAPTAAPGLPTTETAPNRKHMILDLGPRETMIAIGVTILAVCGLLWGGFTVYRNFISTADTGLTEAKGAEKGGEPAPLKRQTGPSAKPLLTAKPAEEAATTAALIGTWVSRTDDDNSSVLDFRPEGIAYVSNTVDASQPGEPTQGRWAVIQREENVATIAIYYANSGLDMHRMRIELASPDCINVLQTAFGGKVTKWDHRYVRELLRESRP